MCGRAKMDSDWQELKIRFEIPDDQSAINFQPSWNIPPTSSLPIVRDNAEGARTVEMMKWGLRPFWAKDPKMTFSTSNARAEGIDSARTFSPAWKQGRRCIVPLDLFYEWKTLGPKEKQPYAIALADLQIMAMAGLYEIWTDESKEVIKTFTIITTAANEQMAALHSRMPVILDKPDWPAWLGEDPLSPDDAKKLLVPYAGELAIWPVDKRVGNWRNNDPSIADPIELAA